MSADVSTRNVRLINSQLPFVLQNYFPAAHSKDRIVYYLLAVPTSSRLRNILSLPPADEDSERRSNKESEGFQQ